MNLPAFLLGVLAGTAATVATIGAWAYWFERSKKIAIHFYSDGEACDVSGRVGEQSIDGWVLNTDGATLGEIVWRTHTLKHPEATRPPRKIGP